jgi:hypothetical protein
VKSSQKIRLGFVCGPKIFFFKYFFLFLCSWAISGRAFFGGNNLFQRTWLRTSPRLICGPPAVVTSLSYTPPIQDLVEMSKTNLRTRAIQEPVFSVANTDFEGGGNDNGYGDQIFLAKHGQPSHDVLWFFYAKFPR